MGRKGSPASQPAAEPLFPDRHIYFLPERLSFRDAEAAEALAKAEPKTPAGAAMKIMALPVLISRLRQRNVALKHFACIAVAQIRRLRSENKLLREEIERLTPSAPEVILSQEELDRFRFLYVLEQ